MCVGFHSLPLSHSLSCCWSLSTFQIVTGGTKGSDKADALPTLKSSKEKTEEAATVQDVVRTEEDLDANFKTVVGRAISAWDAVEVRERPTEDDGNKTFRTRLVSVWMLSNAGLAVAIAVSAFFCLLSFRAALSVDCIHTERQWPQHLRHRRREETIYIFQLSEMDITYQSQLLTHLSCFHFLLLFF